MFDVLKMQDPVLPLTDRGSDSFKGTSLSYRVPNPILPYFIRWTVIWQSTKIVGQALSVVKR